MLGQCRSLAHLDLSDNRIGAHGAGRLRAVTRRLKLFYDDIKWIWERRRKKEEQGKGEEGET